MALAGALKTIPDEPGNVVVVIFPDNIFKYASSMQRHFPDICPTDKREGASDGPSNNDIYVDRLMENLKNKYDSVRVTQLSEELASKDAPLIVDVRTPEMFGEVYIEGSINIPTDELQDRLSELPEDRGAKIVMVCGIGKFSKNTVLLLKSMGYRNVRSAKGGINEWVRKKLPTQSVG